MSACFTAYFQTGDNTTTGAYEFSIKGATTPTPPTGQLQWDSSGDPDTMDSGPTSVTLTVPQNGGGNPITWTIAGTSIQLTPTGTYGNITQVSVMVAVSGGDSTTASLTVKFYDASGNLDSHALSAAAPATPTTASVTPRSGFTAVRVVVTGTIELVDEYSLSANDNTGYIYVYTSSCNT